VPSLAPRAAIRRHDERSYILNPPTIFDEAYDRLAAELRRIESQLPGESAKLA
jgi:NAD-dependent DNA ligase